MKQHCFHSDLFVKGFYWVLLMYKLVSSGFDKVGFSKDAANQVLFSSII